MPWNWIAVEHPMRHTQIAEKIKPQCCKGSVKVQAGKKGLVFSYHFLLPSGAAAFASFHTTTSPGPVTFPAPTTTYSTP